MASAKETSEYWGSRFGVMLAVAGSAVGLGNFLRFPGQVVKYGGGAFLLPYFISLLLVAIPLAMSEWALGRCGGRNGRHSPFGIFYSVSGGSRFFGCCGSVLTLTSFIVGMYYIFIESWCLFYAVQYLGGCLAPLGLGFSLLPNIDPGLCLEDSDAYVSLFGSLVGIGADGSVYRPLLLFTVVCAATNFLLIYLGITKGIERFCKWTAPAIVLCSLFVIIRAATLGNPTGIEGRSFLDGLGFMWNPTQSVALDGSSKSALEIMVDPETWLAATSQIFFTVSVAFGAIGTYASYLRSKDDIALTSITATATNEFCEVVLGGLMAIPAAIMFLGPNSKLASSFALGFNALPNVFGQMPLGQLVGFAFFLLLFLAAVTSSISQLQPISAMCQEAFQWTRRRSVLVCSVFYLAGAAIVAWFTRNLVALDVFDFWIGNMFPFLFGVVQTILIVFVWNLPNLQRELEQGALIKVPRWIGPLIKYASLPYLCCVFALWCRYNLGAKIEEMRKEPASLYSLIFIAFLIVTILCVSICVMKRWKQKSSDGNI